MRKVQLFSCGLWLLERRPPDHSWPNNPWKPFPKCILLASAAIYVIQTKVICNFRFQTFLPHQNESLQDSKDFCRFCSLLFLQCFVWCYFSSVQNYATHMYVSSEYLLEGRGKEGKKEGQMNFTQQSLKPKTKCLRKEVSWLIYSNGLTEKACGCSSQQAFSEHPPCTWRCNGWQGYNKEDAVFATSDRGLGGIQAVLNVI